MTDRILLEDLRRGECMHALLFAGPDGSERTVLARRAAAMFCLEQDRPEALAECPNYIELVPEKGDRIGVDDIRRLNAAASVQTFSGGRRVLFIPSAHRMNVEAQNALLKTLEEPPDNTLIILEGQEAPLLATILSRCAIWRVGGLGETELTRRLTADGIAPGKAAAAARRSCGVEGRARLFCTEEYTAFKTEAEKLLTAVLLGMHAPFTAARDMLETEYFKAEKTGPKGKKTVSHEGDDSEDAGKKKRLTRNGNTDLFLELLSSLLRDAVLIKTGSDKLCPDAETLSEKMARRYTLCGLMSMTDAVREACRQRSFDSDAVKIIDLLLLSCKESEREKT